MFLKCSQTLSLDQLVLSERLLFSIRTNQPEAAQIHLIKLAVTMAGKKAT